VEVDWKLVGEIGGPVALLVIGAVINRLFERRVALISFYLHSSAVHVNPAPPGHPFVAHIHAIVLRNAGGLTATNVRLHHHTLPDFTIYPSVPHTTQALPDGSEDIVIPQMVPKEQLQITYFYYPPLLYNQVNAGIKCDQGFARQIPVLPQRQFPKWFGGLVWFLLYVGTVALLYALWVGGRAVWIVLSAAR
jgi:hypothetical protein